MIAFQICNHAEVRMNQRAFRRKDIEIIERYGEFVDDGAIMLTFQASRKAIDDARSEIKRLETWRRSTRRDTSIKRLRQRIQLLERNRNRKIVMTDGVLVTAYLPTHRGYKQTIRKKRAKGF